MSKGIDGKNNYLFLEDIDLPRPSFDIFVCLAHLIPNRTDQPSSLFLIHHFISTKLCNKFLDEE
jgi:hypothetical protein